VWVDAFEMNGYRFDEVATVVVRNSLLQELEQLVDAYWLAKNIVVLRPAPAANSPDDVAWRGRTAKLLADTSVVRWFRLAETASLSSHQLFERDAATYQALLRRRHREAPSTDASMSVPLTGAAAPRSGTTPAVASTATAAVTATATTTGSVLSGSGNSTDDMLALLLSQLPPVDGDGLTPHRELLRLYMEQRHALCQVALIRDMNALQVTALAGDRSALPPLQRLHAVVWNVVRVRRPRRSSKSQQWTRGCPCSCIFSRDRTLSLTSYVR
jgi:hypothetical protein